MGLCDNPVEKKKKRKFRQPPKSSGQNAAHRYRTDPKIITQWSDWEIFQPEDLEHPVDPVLTSVPSKHQIMHDTHGFIQHWYNPICHEKYDGVNYSIPSIVDGDGTIVSFNNSPGFLEAFRATCPFLTPAQLDELALKSEQELVNIVVSKTDIFNFIREIIGVINGNLRVVKRFASLYERIAKAFDDAYKRLISQGHKETAAYWLAWNFAIKPFLSDLQDLLCAASALHKKMEWLRRNNGKVIYRTFTKEFDLPVDPDWLNGANLVTVNKADPPEMANGQYTQQLRYHSVKLRYVARAKIRLNMPAHLLDGAHGGMGALWAAYHGLTNPVAVIWEAIPFSWLIDYFLSYRSRLFQVMYDFNPFNEGVEVLGFGHSFKLEAIALGRIGRILPLLTEEWSPAERVDYSIYRREAGLPHSSQATYFRVPDNWYQLSIIGAVGVGRLPGRRRKPSR